MARPSLVETLRLFEARYQRGYRYLDKCGQLMLQLEEVLSERSRAMWLPVDATPQGAQMRCPEHDLELVVDATRFILKWSPTDRRDLDSFVELASDAYAQVAAVIRIDEPERFGLRQHRIRPTDDRDDALSLSARYVSDTRIAVDAGDLSVTEGKMTVVYEDSERRSGLSVTLSPYWNAGAEGQVDPRLRMRPHHLPTGQHEVLVEQLRRQRRRELQPDAGLLIDTDVYQWAPSNETTARAFIDASLARALSVNAE